MATAQRSGPSAVSEASSELRSRRHVPQAGAVRTVCGIAADGYTRAEAGGKAAAIRDKFFVIRDIVGVGYVTVTISGPAGSHTVNVNAGFPQYRTPFVLPR